MRKKIFVIICSIMLMMMCITPAMAADCAEGDTHVVSIPFNAGTITSGQAILTYSQCSFVSLSWSLPTDPSIQDKNGKDPLFGFDNPTNTSGKLNVKVKADKVGNASVTADFTWQNDGVKTSGGRVTKSFVVGCATHKYSESITDATCTTDGLKVQQCSVCGDVVTTVIPKLGHSLKDVKVTKEATCTEAGSKEGVCSRCGQTVKETIPAKGHKPGEYLPMYEGDCQHNAIEQAVCSVCGETVVRETTLGSHKFENPVLVQEATLTKPEIYEGTCTVCGETTQQIGMCKAFDELLGLTFTCAEGVFPEGTQLKVGTFESDSEEYLIATSSLDGISTIFTLFDLGTFMGETIVEPNGSVEVVFPIPEDYGKNVGLYYIDDDGAIESIGGKISADGTTFTANLTHFSSYALCVLNGAMPIAKDANNILLYVIIALAVLNIIQLILYLRKGKGKKEEVVLANEDIKEEKTEAFKGVIDKIEAENAIEKVENSVTEEVNKESMIVDEPQSKKPRKAKKTKEVKENEIKKDESEPKE